VISAKIAWIERNELSVEHERRTRGGHWRRREALEISEVLKLQMCHLNDLMASMSGLTREQV
jgi:hypothetical protein